MKSEKNLASLWIEFSLLGNIDQRRIIVSQNTQSKLPRYRILAEDNPYRFFELLDGDTSEITCSNWAVEQIFYYQNTPC